MAFGRIFWSLSGNIVRMVGNLTRKGVSIGSLNP
jgi:hypothetical protein